jgi:predicted phosphoadenosine phosphosulfate sulfurtransferase
VYDRKISTPEGKRTYSVIGLRVQESRNRRLGIYSAKQFTAWFPAEGGTYNAFPIYDWLESDVWRAYKVMNWDFNQAYNVQWRLGLSSSQLRIGPPTLNMWAIRQFSTMWRAWPEWSEKVFQRLPGTRAAAMYGVRAIQPQRWPGETWQQVFQRECIDQAPWWIAERSRALRDRVIRLHEAKSTTPFPEINSSRVGTALGSWRRLTQVCYTGDPFCLHTKGAQPFVDVRAFRHGPPQPGSIYNEPRMSS